MQNVTAQNATAASKTSFTPLQSGPQALSVTPGVTPARLMSIKTSPAGYPVYHYLCQNGHAIYIEKRPTQVVSLRTFIDTGSIYENPMPLPGSTARSAKSVYPETGFPSGIAHLDEHCRFLSTQHFPQKNTWTAEIEKSGTNLNASTDNEVIQHELMFNRENLDTMVPMHAESVLRPLYLENNLDQERTNVINEAREKVNELSFKMMDEVMMGLFGRSRAQTLGSEGDVRRTTAGHLQAFHHNLYLPERMATVVSGDVEPERLAQQLNEEFGKNPKRASLLPPATMQLVLGPSEKKILSVSDSKVTQGHVMLGFPGPGKSNFKDQMAVDLLLTHLNSGPYALMPLLLGEQWKLVHNIESFYLPMKTTGLISLVGNTQPGQQEQGLAAMLGLLKQLGQKPLDSGKLDALKTRLAYNFKQKLDYNETVTAMMGDMAVHGALDYYMNYLDILKSITPEDLQRVANTYLNPNRYVAVVGVPTPEAKPSPAANAMPLASQPFYPGQPL